MKFSFYTELVRIRTQLSAINSQFTVLLHVTKLPVNVLEIITGAYAKRLSPRLRKAPYADYY
jgi:hypothetical protein